MKARAREILKKRRDKQLGDIQRGGTYEESQGLSVEAKQYVDDVDRTNSVKEEVGVIIEEEESSFFLTGGGDEAMDYNNNSDESFPVDLIDSIPMSKSVKQPDTSHLPRPIAQRVQHVGTLIAKIATVKEEYDQKVFTTNKAIKESKSLLDEFKFIRQKSKSSFQ